MTHRFCWYSMNMKLNFKGFVLNEKKFTVNPNCKQQLHKCIVVMFIDDEKSSLIYSFIYIIYRLGYAFILRITLM